MFEIAFVVVCCAKNKDLNFYVFFDCIKILRKGDIMLSNTKAQAIVDLDLKKLLEMLNTAYADEWIAYYQYWLCAKLVTGPIRPSVVVELEEHAGEELKHAQKLADRIIQLGGIPLVSPQSWYEHAGCGYDATRNAYVRAVLEENIKAEKCAIESYNTILKFIGDKDPITYDIIVNILRDEVKHEEDLTKLLQDLNTFEQEAKSK